MKKIAVILSTVTVTSFSALAAADPPEPTCVTIQRSLGGAVQDSDINPSYGSWPAGAYPNLGTGGNQHHSLVQFDVSAIPVNASVTSATFAVYQQWTSQYTTVNAHQVLEPWAESTVSWANFGDPANWNATPVGSFTTSSSPGYRTIDLTALVQLWVDAGAPNHGLVLEEAPGASHTFAASESSSASKQPKLTVCYVETVTCASDPCQNGGTCADEGTSYVCTCPPEWIGQSCETPNPCQGGGVYIPDGETYSCACPVGTTGQDCEIPFDFCAGVSCQNGGVCDPAGAIPDALCTCPAGFSGSFCQYSDTCLPGEVFENGACGAPTVCPCTFSAAWSQTLAAPDGVIFDLTATVGDGDTTAAYLTDPAAFPYLTSGLLTPNQAVGFAVYDPTDLDEEGGVCAVLSRPGGAAAITYVTAAEGALCVAAVQAANTPAEPVPDLPAPFALLGAGLAGLAAALRNRLARKSGK